MADEEKRPQVGDVVWSCPVCGSEDVDPIDDPDYDGSELLSVCKDCGHSGEDDEFKAVITSVA